MSRLSAYPLIEKFIRWLLAHAGDEFDNLAQHLARYAPASELAEVESSLEQIVRDVVTADDARNATEAK